MRRLPKLLLLASLPLLALLPASEAKAQLDVNPPVPNVLLLIDTSGSMENMIDGRRPAAAGAACQPGTATPMNRWATLVSVLTGSIRNFSCHAVSRSSDAFRDEYSYLGALPYDYKYHLPFHRLLSNGCTPGPGVAPSTWYGWPDGAINFHDYSDRATACASPGWQQDNDGILDTFRDRLRFGLMTFDPIPEPHDASGTGAVGTLPDGQSGMAGTWSYYENWHGGGSPAFGQLPNCPNRKFEVGGRNPAAPPWEGRLLPFGAFDLPLADVVKLNERVQQAVAAMRPYGGTPIAGMLEDAATFILKDTSIDPTTDKAFGPSNDPFFKGGCRDTFIVLLSDGEPNLDLREDCAAVPGGCPFRQPHEVAGELFRNADPNLRVSTFSIGFGLASGAGVDCNTLTGDDYNTGGRCVGATGSLQACCTLSRIAFEGGTQRAYFADDPLSLRTALSTVLGKIAQGSTARTLPSFAGASASAGGAAAASYQFVSSFEVPPGTSLWTGNLERKRYLCQDEDQDGLQESALVPVDASKGDDFGANLDASGSGDRRFYTALGAKDTTSSAIHSRRTIRPAVASGSVDDGLGGYTWQGDMGLKDALGFRDALGMAPEALEIGLGSSGDDCAKALGVDPSNHAECARRVVNWHIGEVNAGLLPTRNPAACPAGQRCSKLGSIYHSTPASMGPPRALVQDESYGLFAASAAAKRPTVLFTATTDGQLHAFKVAANDPADLFKVDEKKNNELWSFFPPAVLPRLLSSYNQQAILLDGAPVVKDVVFERDAADAKGLTSQWSTVLVSGGGAGGGFYYALDVTDPKSPRFLWQLSTDASGSPLFGEAAGAPGIATISLADGSGVKEVAVAILPGGKAPRKDGECARQKTDWNLMKPSDTTLAPRSKVHCFGSALSSDVGPARSLTIVRLDSGEVLMNFRGADGDGPASLLGKTPARARTVFFDAPITGVPVPYPALPGQVADRLYVGDADGTLWRIDLSSPDPSKWDAQLAWDAYPFQTDTAQIGEPIETTPIVSVDALGNTVVLFSTGDQETFTASNVKTRLWSITERPARTVTLGGLPFEIGENWVKRFDDKPGRRVTGPISLFNGIAYFATYTPTPGGTNSCEDGFGSVCGYDFTKREAPTTLDPKPRYAPKDPNDPSAGYFGCADRAPGTVVFGVAVTQTPTCSNEVQTQDAYFGPRTYLSGISPGEYQLVFQTGKVGQAEQGAKTNTVTETLPPPIETTRIESWASILE